VLGAVLFRLVALIAFVLMAFQPERVLAAPADGDLQLGNPCVMLGAPTADPTRLIKDSAPFDCTRDPRNAEADTMWVRYDLSNAAVEGETGWTYDHALIQARGERVWIAYADGRVRESLTTREEARRVLGGSTQRYAFAREQGQIVGLLARVDGLQNRRGPVPRASLTSEARTATNLARYYLVFGLMAGIMFGILFYNVTLFAALRYRVLAAYCLSISTTLLYGIVASNVILWFAPGMTTATQFGWNALAISLGFLTTNIYLQAFVEQGMVPRALFRTMGALGVGVVALSVTRIFGEFVDWPVFDGIVYAFYLSLIALMIVSCTIAWRRGSRAVRFYLLAWTAPVAITFARILWGLGNVAVESAVFDASPFVSLCFEALLSAIGLSWRLRQLRAERDEALDLAEIDPLTGLLNRRSFTAQACEGNLPKRLVLIDVDHFKSINDCFGHQAGDDVLCRLARVLTDNAPPGALIGRLGGEEFAVLVRADAAPTLAETLRRSVAAAAFPNDVKVTVSAGFAIAHVSDDDSWRTIYAAADEALYAAKHAGRNKVREARISVAA
jgi:diguanylate cyclase (GGDEF)-like protein